MFKKNIYILILLCVSSLIFLTNLNGQFLSLDEPETVFLGKSIAKYGFPSPWFENNLISGSNGMDSRIILGNYVWTWHPWLQHYIAFLSITIFGDTAGGARVLFAVFGVLTVLMTYKIALELFERKTIAFLVGMQLIFLLPFFLYIRQVRYYSPATFFSIVSLWLLITYIKNKWKKQDYYIFTLNGILLFLSNYLIWVSFVVNFIIILVIKRNKIINFILCGQIILAITWYIIMRPYGGNIMVSNFIHETLFNNFNIYLSYINGFIFPILLPLIAFLLTRKNRLFLMVLCVWCFTKLTTYTIFLNPHGRYLIDLFPVFALMFGYIYLYLWEKKYYIFLTFIIIIFSTGNFIHTNSIKQLILTHKISYNLTFWPLSYKSELTRSYPNALIQIGEYLKSSYKPGDLFWSNLFPNSIFLTSGVPSISPICDKSTLKFQGPISITNPEKIRWFIFYPHESAPQSIISSPCLDQVWQKRLHDNYVRKTLHFSQGTVLVNDPDVINRRFPPTLISSEEVIIYERK